MIHRLPDSLQQAKLLVGTRLQVWVQPEEDQPGRWHPAKIVQASYGLGDGGDPINVGKHFLVRSVHQALILHSCRELVSTSDAPAHAGMMEPRRTQSTSALLRFSMVSLHRESLLCAWLRCLQKPEDC